MSEQAPPELGQARPARLSAGDDGLTNPEREERRVDCPERGARHQPHSAVTEMSLPVGVRLHVLPTRRPERSVLGDHSARSGRRQKLLDRGAQGTQQHLEVWHGVAVGDHAEEHVAVIAQRGNAANAHSEGSVDTLPGAPGNS